MRNNRPGMSGGPKRAAVGILRLDFRVLGSRSLKEKRATVRSFVERARSRFPVSISESGYQEDHALSSVTAAVVSARVRGADEVLGALADMLATDYPVDVLAAEAEISEGE